MGQSLPLSGLHFPTFWSQQPDQSSGVCQLQSVTKEGSGSDSESRLGGWLLGQPSAQLAHRVVGTGGGGGTRALLSGQCRKGTRRGSERS